MRSGANTQLLSSTQPLVDVNDVFKYFPAQSHWKLFMDGMYWAANDKYLFDQQDSPNYLKNSAKGLYLSLTTINEPLSLDLIIGLHDVVFPIPEGISIYQSLHTEVMFNIVAEFLSLDGLVELIDKIRNDHIPLTINYRLTDNDLKNHTIHFHPNYHVSTEIPLDASKSSTELAYEILQKINDPQQVISICRESSAKITITIMMQKLIATYQQNINKAQDNEELKLSAIAEFIRDMHQFHPFLDGNGRTFIFIILNKLLIQNHLSPTTIYMPGVFSGFSIKELVEEIKKGQKAIQDMAVPDENKNFMQDLYRDADLTEAENAKAILFLRLPTLLESYPSNEESKRILDAAYQTIWLDIFPKLNDVETITLLMKFLQPKENLLREPYISKLLISCAENSNFYQINLLIGLIKSSDDDITLARLQQPELLGAILFSDMGITQIREIFANLNVTSHALFLTLNNVYFKNLQNNSFLIKMLEGQKYENLISAFDQLDDNDFITFMNTKLTGLNNAQVIVLFANQDFYKYVKQKYESLYSSHHHMHHFKPILSQPINLKLAHKVIEVRQVDVGSIIAISNNYDHKIYLNTSQNRNMFYTRKKETEINNNNSSDSPDHSHKLNP